MCQPVVTIHLHTAKVSVCLIKIVIKTHLSSLRIHTSHNNTITKKNTLLKVPVKF